MHSLDRLPFSILSVHWFRGNVCIWIRCSFEIPTIHFGSHKCYCLRIYVFNQMYIIRVLRFKMTGMKKNNWECLQILVGFNVSERTNFQPRFGPIFEFSMEFGIFTSFILFVINFSDILTFAHFDIIFIGVFIFYHQDDEQQKKFGEIFLSHKLICLNKLLS